MASNPGNNFLSPHDRTNAYDAMHGLIEELCSEVHDLRTQNASLETRILAINESKEPKGEQVEYIVALQEKFGKKSPSS